ncbi:MAG TPA: hypothetical protein VJ372_03635 [Pyrinomonadaceae bacterium]|jgi:hypothetical protein|nr:hypothetical protein [Pyrinomonadaceae bacterium]
MTCPRCDSAQSDEVKFCTVCGANLQAVRQALVVRPEDQFSWSNTWVAEMFLTAQEQKKRKAAIERAIGITPEVKRYNEIKAGVIASSVGIAVSIFLYVFMQGLILNSHVSRDAAVILSNVWVAGIIPFFVGLALITNGLVVSKKLVEISKRDEAKNLEGGTQQSLPAPDTNDFSASPFSVTEQTTRHLQGSDQK